MATIWSRYWKLVWELIRKKRNEQFPCVLIALMSLPDLNKCWPSGADGISLPWRLVPFLSGFLSGTDSWQHVLRYSSFSGHCHSSQRVYSQIKDKVSWNEGLSGGNNFLLYRTLFNLWSSRFLQVTERNGRSNLLGTSGPWFPSLQWQCYGSFGPWDGR